MTSFLLGTHMPHWLATAGVPLFVSRRRLTGRKCLPKASAPWALDSGGFTELSMFGRWCTEPARYADDALRFQAEIGSLLWAAPQDWMCEPWIIEKTGLTVEEHQRRTIASWFRLRELAPSVNWLPVIQGFEPVDYTRHVNQWDEAGVDLREFPLVGIGSVCRRQGTRAISDIVKLITWRGIRLHGFGVKANGLRQYGRYLTSADSLAWSYAARREAASMAGHPHKNCASCLPYALNWRAKLVGEER